MPPATNPNANLQRTYYGLVILFLVLAALYFGRSVLLPLALASLFAFILTPGVAWLERHHFRRVPAVLFAVVLVFAVLGGLGYVLTLQMGHLADQLAAAPQLHQKKLKS